eukprot:Rmarinus@m.17637
MSAAGSACPQTTWSYIRDRLHPSEVDEVRSIIGNTLIDEHDDLVAALDAYSDILSDYQKEVLEKERKKKDCVGLFSSSPFHKRADIQIQIRVFISSLRDHGSMRNVNPMGALTHREKEIVDLLENGDDHHRRSSTPRPEIPSFDARPESRSSWRPGTASSSHPGTARCSERSTSISEPEAVLRGVTDKINVFDIDKILHTVRVAIKDENMLLQEDTNALMEFLDDTHAAAVEADAVDASVPSDSELGGLRDKLKVLVENPAHIATLPDAHPPIASADALQSPRTKETPLSVKGTSQLSRRSHVGIGDALALASRGMIRSLPASAAHVRAESPRLLSPSTLPDVDGTTMSPTPTEHPSLREHTTAGATMRFGAGAKKGKPRTHGDSISARRVISCRQLPSPTVRGSGAASPTTPTAPLPTSPRMEPSGRCRQPGLPSPPAQLAPAPSLSPRSPRDTASFQLDQECRQQTKSLPCSPARRRRESPGITKSVIATGRTSADSTKGGPAVQGADSLTKNERCQASGPITSSATCTKGVETERRSKPLCPKRIPAVPSLSLGHALGGSAKRPSRTASKEQLLHSAHVCSEPRSPIHDCVMPSADHSHFNSSTAATPDSKTKEDGCPLKDSSLNRSSNAEVQKRTVKRLRSAVRDSQTSTDFFEGPLKGLNPS